MCDKAHRSENNEQVEPINNRKLVATAITRELRLLTTRLHWQAIHSSVIVRVKPSVHVKISPSVPSKYEFVQ